MGYDELRNTLDIGAYSAVTYSYFLSFKSIRINCSFYYLYIIILNFIKYLFIF